MSATAKKFDITKHEEFIFDGFRIGITPILRDIQDGIQTNCGLHAFYIEIGTVNNVVDHEHYGGIATKYSAAYRLDIPEPIEKLVSVTGTAQDAMGVFKYTFVIEFNKLPEATFAVTIQEGK